MTTTESDKQESAKNFMDEQQKLAEAAGMNVFEYMAQAEGGILKPTIIKLLKHAQVHPKECPSDCTFQASLKKLKDKYGVAA